MNVVLLSAMFDMSPEYLVCIALVMLISLPLHELAHARTALAFGDETAKLMGRVTFNPLAHLDVMGTIAFFLVGFGWAKPVPVNPANLHPRRMGNIAVSMAGPLSNLGLAVLAGLALRFFPDYSSLLDKLHVGNLHFSSGLAFFLAMLMQLNLCLCIFNLIPLYPLDGHHIQREILPADWQVRYMYWQMQYGRFALLAIIFLPNILGTVFHLQHVPDPLSLFFRYVGGPIVDLLIGSPPPG